MALGLLIDFPSLTLISRLQKPEGTLHAFRRKAGQDGLSDGNVTLLLESSANPVGMLPVEIRHLFMNKGVIPKNKTCPRNPAISFASNSLAPGF